MGKNEGMETKDKVKKAVHGAYVADKLDVECLNVSSTCFIFNPLFSPV